MSFSASVESLFKMGIPDEIKENVRAVLLSKTDGSGILVSAFLKDYKAMIFEPLRYKAYGYETLEKFINDIPDVCRYFVTLYLYVIRC